MRKVVSSDIVLWHIVASKVQETEAMVVNSGTQSQADIWIIAMAGGLV